MIIFLKRALLFSLFYPVSIMAIQPQDQKPSDSFSPVVEGKRLNNTCPPVFGDINKPLVCWYGPKDMVTDQNPIKVLKKFTKVTSCVDKDDIPGAEEEVKEECCQLTTPQPSCHDPDKLFQLPYIPRLISVTDEPSKKTSCVMSQCPSNGLYWIKPASNKYQDIIEKFNKTLSNGQKVLDENIVNLPMVVNCHSDPQPIQIKCDLPKTCPTSPVSCSNDTCEVICKSKYAGSPDEIYACMTATTCNKSCIFACGQSNPDEATRYACRLAHNNANTNNCLLCSDPGKCPGELQHDPNCLKTKCGYTCRTACMMAFPTAGDDQDNCISSCTPIPPTPTPTSTPTPNPTITPTPTPTPTVLPPSA